MEPLPVEEPSPSRKSKRTGVKALIRIVVSAVFVLSCYGAGKLAVRMASADLPETVPTREPAGIMEEVTLQGSRDEPLFLGSDQEALRAFFANYPTAESRAGAPLGTTGIRRIPDSLQVRTMRAEADAIQVRVTDGAVAGAVYWVHHSQVKQEDGFAPIISPIPGATVE